MNLFEENGAKFSECRRYRYALWRIWDASKPKVMFIGLNPSTANETKDDPTIRRVKRFAYDWGFGGVYMLNLFAFVTPYPEELKICADPIGEGTNWLKRIGNECKEVIFAWGSFNVFGRDAEIAAMFPGAKALQINQNGTPKHPLYVRSDIVPVPFATSPPSPTAQPSPPLKP